MSQLVAYLCILCLFFFETESVCPKSQANLELYVGKDDPELLDPPASITWLVELQTCTTMPSLPNTGFLRVKKELYHLSYKLSYSSLLSKEQSECAFQKVSQIMPCSWAWASGTHLMQSKHSSLHSILQGSASGGVPQAPSSWISSAPLCLVPTVLQTQWPLCYSWNILPFRHPQGQTLTSSSLWHLSANPSWATMLEPSCPAPHLSTTLLFPQHRALLHLFLSVSLFYNTVWLHQAWDLIIVTAVSQEPE